MSGTTIRVIDLPDLGSVTDVSSIVADKTGTGRFSALALKSYCATVSIPEAPSTNSPYGRQNGAWTPVLADAPSNGSSYARLNATWSVVPPEAPLTGSIYGRGNSAWTPVLPISGGTVSGSLGVGGNLAVAGATSSDRLAVGASIGYAWAFYAQPGAGNHIQEHAPNWFDSFLVGNGMRQWNAPGLMQMSLDATGSLTVANSVVAGGSVYATGNVTGSAAVWQTPSVFGFAPGGQGRIFYFAPTYYWEWNSTTGQQTWISNGTPMWNMRASDALCFNSVGVVGGNGPYLNTSDRRVKANIVPTAKGLAEVLQLQPVSFTRDYPGVPTGAPEEIGFVAQDVQPIVPEAVWEAGMTTTRDGEATLALSESTLTALNVNAIKELNALIVGLRDRIATLEGKAA